MTGLTETARKLSAASRRHYRNPYDVITWPESVDHEQWFTSPRLISLQPTEYWQSLDESAQKRLSFWEAINFYSLNIHGERWLMQGLAARLHKPGLEEFAEYLHHFLDEENKHSIWFSTFCTRYGGKIYRDRSFAFDHEYAPGEEDLLFFGRVVVFEEIVDQYNVEMGRDESLVEVCRRINAEHHADESRHLMFGRKLVQAMWQRFSPEWSEDVKSGVAAHFVNYLTSTWKSFYEPQIYVDSGVADLLDGISPYELSRAAWSDVETRAFRVQQSQRVVDLFQDIGILQEAPL